VNKGFRFINNKNVLPCPTRLHHTQLQRWLPGFGGHHAIRRGAVRTAQGCSKQAADTGGQAKESPEKAAAGGCPTAQAAANWEIQESGLLRPAFPADETVQQGARAGGAQVAGDFRQQRLQ